MGDYVFCLFTKPGFLALKMWCVNNYFLLNSLLAQLTTYSCCTAAIFFFFVRQLLTQSAISQHSAQAGGMISVLHKTEMSLPRFAVLSYFGTEHSRKRWAALK